MNIFDFITQEEIDDLPDDDPEAAFTGFVRHAQRRLNEHTTKLNGNEEDDWRMIEEARYGFMNVVIAAGKKFEIEPFSTLQVPRLEKFSSEVHRQFKADLDHYLTQLLLNNSTRGKKDSVLIPVEVKASIRTYVHHLRDTIDAADIDEPKKSKLLKKLAEFEAELEKKRLSLVAVAVFSITFLGAPGAIWSSADVGQRLVSNILGEIEGAKASEDHRRLPIDDSPRAITGPRAVLLEDRRNGSRESFNQDLEDEIPF